MIAYSLVSVKEPFGFEFKSFSRNLQLSVADPGISRGMHQPQKASGW